AVRPSRADIEQKSGTVCLTHPATETVAGTAARLRRAAALDRAEQVGDGDGQGGGDTLDVDQGQVPGAPLDVGQVRAVDARPSPSVWSGSGRGGRSRPGSTPPTGPRRTRPPGWRTPPWPSSTRSSPTGRRPGPARSPR